MLVRNYSIVLLVATLLLQCTGSDVRYFPPHEPSIFALDKTDDATRLSLFEISAPAHVRCIDVDGVAGVARYHIENERVIVTNVSCTGANSTAAQCLSSQVLRSASTSHLASPASFIVS